MADHAICAAFYLPPSDVEPHPWAAGILRHLGVRSNLDRYGDLLADWGGQVCTVEVVEAEPYRVLALLFDQYGFAAAVGDGTPDPAAGGPGDLAEAFRSACDRLRPPVGFVLSHQVGDLPEFLTGYAGHVADNDVYTVIRAGFGLVYVREPGDTVDDLLRYDPRDELPVTQGRLIFAGQGPRRWWG